MTRVVSICAGLVVGLCLHTGCQSAPPSGGRAPQPPAVKATNSIAARPPSDSRSYEQRAEADARLMAGVTHDLNDEPEQAIEAFSKAVLADPDNEALTLDLSTRLIMLKRFERAAALLNQSLKRPGASAQIDTRLAFVLQRMSRTNDAIHANEAAIRKAPKSIGAYENLFNLYRQNGQTNEAVRVVEQAARVPNPDAEFLVELSEMYFLQGRPSQGTNGIANTRAHDVLKRAADLNPTNFFVLQKLADGFTQLRDTKRAAATLVRLQLLHPDMPNIRERLLDMYLRDRDKKGAAEQLESLIRDNPTNPQGYYLLGMLAFDEQRFKEAADHFHKTLLLNPNFEPAYYELAVCKMNLKQPKEALEVLAQAREKFKNSFLSEYFSALAYMRMQDYTNAIQRLTSAEIIASATDTNRLTHVFYFQLGSACERAGRWGEGEKYLLKSLKLSPDSPEALNYLGYMYAERGTNLTQARAMLEQALKQEPDNTAYLDSLGWVCFQQGKLRDALKYIQRAIDLDKEPDATLFDHLGDVQAALKEFDKARASWRKALTLEPKPEIQKKLDHLKP